MVNRKVHRDTWLLVTSTFSDFLAFASAIDWLPNLNFWNFLNTMPRTLVPGTGTWYQVPVLSFQRSVTVIWEQFYISSGGTNSLGLSQQLCGVVSVEDYVVPGSGYSVYKGMMYVPGTMYHQGPPYMVLSWLLNGVPVPGTGSWSW